MMLTVRLQIIAFALKKYAQMFLTPNINHIFDP